MAKVRVQAFSVSLDGFGTGEGLTDDEPFGHAGERLHEWMFAALDDGRRRHQLDKDLVAGSRTASAPRSWAGASSTSGAARCPTTGRASGEPSRPSTHRCSC